MNQSRSEEQLELLGQASFTKNKAGIPNLEFYWHQEGKAKTNEPSRQIVDSTDDEPGTSKGLVITFVIVLVAFIYTQFIK